MDQLPVATVHGYYTPALGNCKIPAFSSLLGRGPTANAHIVSLPKGVQQTPAEAEAWSRVGEVLQSMERDGMRCVAPTPYAGRSMRFETFTRDAVLQILPEAYFSIMHIIMESNGEVRAEVFEGTLGRWRDSFDWGTVPAPGVEGDENAKPIECRELNVMARARFVFLKVDDLWRLESLETGAFSIILGITPVSNPQSATVSPGPGGTNPVAGNHWERAKNMRRQWNIEPHRRREPKLRRPKLREMSTTLYMSSQAGSTLNLARLPDWTPPKQRAMSDFMDKSSSVPQLPSISDVTVRWNSDGCDPSRVMATSSSAPTLKTFSPLSPQQLLTANKRQGRIAAITQDNRRELLFGSSMSPEATMSPGNGKTGLRHGAGRGVGRGLLPNVPLQSRVQALEEHLLHNDMIQKRHTKAVYAAARNPISEHLG